MKFVSLLSGGKDSIFAVMKAVEAGHELVCCANLYPVGTDELDSYMYQSVGYEVAGMLGDAFGKPMYRQPITGTPKVLDMEYGETIDNSDEVEDLYVLLKKVKENHPDVMGVTSGAINSTYQKNRVENICERLGIESVAPLWELPAVPLL